METGPLDAVRTGVVGAGLVAQVVHLPLLQRLAPRFETCALAEPDAGTRELVARRHGLAAFADHHELLEAGAVDAVVVCSPDETHADVVLDALRAGVHVLVEKPLCLTERDAERIVAARDETGLVVQVGYMKRFDPGVEALLAELPDGWTPTHVATATFDPGLREAFGARAGRPGCSSADQAFRGALVHDVNLVQAVLARCGATVLGVVDAFGEADGSLAGGTLVLDGGARWSAVWMALPGAGTFREQLAFYGPDGVRELEFPAPYALHSPTVYRRTRAHGDGAVTASHTSWHEAYERQLLHFHACVTRQVPCRTPPEQALEDIRVLDRLIAAGTAGVPT